MKTYRLIKLIPWFTIWAIFEKISNNQRTNLGIEYNSMIFNDALAKWYFERVKKDYVLTEEGEIIGKYEWDCWYINSFGNTRVRRNFNNIDVGHFITEEQCDRREIKDSALRKIWELYYDNWYEENKGVSEVYYSLLMVKLNASVTIANTSLPHCNEDFHHEMLKIPEIEALYLTYFWIDESRGT